MRTVWVEGTIWRHHFSPVMALKVNIGCSGRFDDYKSEATALALLCSNDFSHYLRINNDLIVS
jgi:hypothetical protein